MSTTVTAIRTHDAPLTSDGAVIVERRAKPPVGQRYEIREDGEDVITVLVATADAAAQPTRAALEDQNAAGLKRVVAAAGGAR